MNISPSTKCVGLSNVPKYLGVFATAAVVVSGGGGAVVVTSTSYPLRFNVVGENQSCKTNQQYYRKLFNNPFVYLKGE